VVVQLLFPVVLQFGLSVKSNKAVTGYITIGWFQSNYTAERGWLTNGSTCTTALVNDVQNLKIGVPKEFFGEGLNSEVRKAIEEAIETYKKLGAEIVEVSLPNSKYALSAYYIIALAEASSNLARYDGVSYGMRVPADNLIKKSTKNPSKRLNTCKVCWYCTDIF